jgi:prophage regulatory protein
LKVISYSELLTAKGIRFSRQWIAKMVATGTFPAPLKIGQRATGFDEAEIDAWLKAKADARSTKRAA